MQHASYIMNASPSDPIAIAFSAMPSVSALLAMKTFRTASAAWPECWTSPDPLHESLAHDPSVLTKSRKQKTHLDVAKIFVLSPPGHSTTWKPAPSGTLNVES